MPPSWQWGRESFGRLAQWRRAKLASLQISYPHLPRLLIVAAQQLAPSGRKYTERKLCRQTLPDLCDLPLLGNIATAQISDDCPAVAGAFHAEVEDKVRHVCRRDVGAVFENRHCFHVTELILDQ